MKDVTSKSNHSKTPSSDTRYYFPKSEKLCKKRVIDYVFEHGKSFKIGVLKFFYAFPVEDDWMDYSLQVAFTAPKRNFKKAVQRNRLKRQMRESYRLNKHAQLVPSSLPEGKIAIFIVLRSYKTPSYKTINWAMKKGLSKINSDLKHIPRNSGG